MRLGFGLHVGWAIEGAIGSEYKIEASYLSPNVNLAARLEAATKQYGVTLLLSEDFVRMLSAGVRRRVRQARRPRRAASAAAARSCARARPAPSSRRRLLQRWKAGSRCALPRCMPSLRARRRPPP